MTNPHNLRTALKRLHHVSGGVIEGNPAKIANIKSARQQALEALDTGCATCGRKPDADYTIGCPGCFDHEHAEEGGAS